MINKLHSYLLDLSYCALLMKSNVVGLCDGQYKYTVQSVLFVQDM
jgi:hypothetical protein